MDRWCRDFDNWGICDTVCFQLFDRTPHAWAKVREWSDKRDEFVKRAAFALLASLALPRQARRRRAVPRRPATHRARRDRRAQLRQEGRELGAAAIGRRNAALNTAAVAVARRLSTSESAAARWIGRGALKKAARVQRCNAAFAERPDVGSLTMNY